MFRKNEKVVEQRDRIIAYKNVFNSSEGRAVLLDLMNKFHVIHTHGGDPYKEGQRSVVLEIMYQSSINLVEFDKLMKGET